MAQPQLRWNVKCGTLETVIVAETAYKAAKKSLKYTKPNQELGDLFLVREVIIDALGVRTCTAVLSYPFERIIQGAGWDMDGGELASL